MNALGLLCELIAAVLVLKGLGHTRAAYAADKPSRVPDWEDFGATDAERVANHARWHQAAYAKGSYIGESARSRKTARLALALVLLGGALIMLDSVGGASP